MAVVTAFTLAVTLAQIFSTIPIPAAWQVYKYGRDPKQTKHFVFIVCAAAINMALDLWTLVLPLPLLKTIRLQRRKKIGVIGVFLLGGL